MIFRKATYDWLVVGLGNPGVKYENTRHNVGFVAAELFAKQNNGSLQKNKMEALYGECSVADNRVLVMEPQTFMNNSGRAVSAVASFYKIPTERIIIISDDISLDVGKIRLRRKGSHGGHNGLKNINELLGRNDYSRIRFGIGGVVTYKKSVVAEAVKAMALEDLILETDCPYLTPAPHRGKRNESAYVEYVCRKIADIHGLGFEQVDSITTASAKQLFGIS